jgi:glucan-binding YG repeat protein
MHTKLLVGIGICCLFISACAQTGTQPQVQPTSVEMKQKLGQRVEKYWQARLDEDYFTTYQMERSSFQEKTPIKLYVQLFGSYNPIKDFSVQEISIDDQEATAFLECTYVLPYARGRVTQEKIKTLEDKWVYEDGQWYHVFQRINI